MRRFLAACLMVASATGVAAPVATADPQDLVPYCSGDQTPLDNNCQEMPHQVFTNDAVGANPEVGLGTNPGLEPVT